MTNEALIYHRPSRWPIETALGTAVLIHLSAVAIAFHREPMIIGRALSDSPFVPGEIIDDPPPDPDLPTPPAPAPPTTDFIAPHETPHPNTINHNPTPIRRVGQTRLSAVGNARAWVVTAPRPAYPYEARSRHLTGTGVAVITIDSTTGVAVDVTMEQSIGNPILDSSTYFGIPSLALQTGSAVARSDPNHLYADRRAVLKYCTNSAAAWAR